MADESVSAPLIRVAWGAVEPGGADPRRDRREVAWALLRELAGPDARLTNPCPRCGGPHGPVRVTGTDVRASVSYAATASGTVAVAGVIGIADAAAFGLDAEASERIVGDALGRPATARDWVRVEAALKADGRGLRVDADTVAVESEEGHGGWTARVPGRPAPLTGTDLPGPPGILISAAYAPVPAPEAMRDPATR